jgi:mycofactocin precursor
MEHDIRDEHADASIVATDANDNDNDNNDNDDTADRAAANDEIVEELLIEEISIDGMCGVY